MFNIIVYDLFCYRIMNTFEITQSSNWYKPNIITMDKFGNLMAYGSRTIIVLVKGLEGNSVYDLQYNRLRLNTKMACGRIGAVSFSHETDTHKDAYYLASIDEVNIYIWQVESMACKHLHSFGVSYFIYCLYIIISNYIQTKIFNLIL